MLDSDFLAAARGEIPADMVLKNVRVINVFSGEIVDTDIAVAQGHIVGLGEYKAPLVVDLKGRYVAPGFIDGHLHIESSMLLPHNFGRTVIRWGTTTVVADPHEIANVLGLDGIALMKASAVLSPIDIAFMAPSCVPATGMETSGARLGPGEIKNLLEEQEFTGLAEVMNFPGVVYAHQDVLEKIRIAGGRPIDGHAPGLSGKHLNAYMAAGVQSDHECTTANEALEKVRAGMHIMIREGSTAKNLEALLPAVNDRNWSRFMFVTDDAHPDELLAGHLNLTLKKAVELGLDPVTAVRMVTLNTARYFGLRWQGAVAPGYQADMVVLEDLTGFHPCMVYKKGELVARDGKPVTAWDDENFPVMTAMNVKLPEKPLAIKAEGRLARVIEVIPGQIVTGQSRIRPPVDNGEAVADAGADLLKVAVVERHKGTGNVGLGFVRGFGLAKGAMASSVAHDSHNIVVVGTNDRDMEIALKEVVDMGGGLAVAAGGKIKAGLPLPVAGLMSDEPADVVAPLLQELKKAAIDIGCRLSDPFITMSFISLPVIPELKITDRGMVDVGKFALVPLFEEDTAVDSTED